MPSIQKLPMPPVLGGMGRINDIDSNDTSRYHPPPTTSMIKSSSVNQLSPSVPQSLSSSVPQFLSFVLGGILDTYKLQVIIFYYIYNKLLNKDKSEGSEKNWGTEELRNWGRFLMPFCILLFVVDIVFKRSTLCFLFWKSMSCGAQNGELVFLT